MRAAETIAFCALTALLGCGSSDTNGGSSGAAAAGGSGASSSGATGGVVAAGGASAGSSHVGGAGGAGASGGSAGTGGAGGLASQTYVDVSHERELRGVWVATVSNLNFPSGSSLSAAEQRAELDSIVDIAAQYRLNAIFFQVRPECDAVYASDIEPWSRYLTGTQGQDPGYDPLLHLVQAAHSKGIEVHAWLNPYRAKANRNSSAATTHISEQLPEYAYEYGSLLWMDPGAAPVRDYLSEVVLDLATRYDIDGIHMDDYFYPYPQSGENFGDGATYAAYQNDGGTLDLGDWRRSNVDQMVQRLHGELQSAAPDVRFGISPFGIYRPGMPPGITGLDQYAEIFADPKLWIEQGWVDYLAPQLYWPSTQTAQAYEPLLEWWSALSSERYIFAGNFLDKIGDSSAWTVDEFRTQVSSSRQYASAGSRGNIFFTIRSFEADTEGVASMIGTELYTTPALPPPLAERPTQVVEPPWVQVTGTSVSIQDVRAQDLQFWTLYVLGPTGWVLRNVLPSTAQNLDLELGTWAVAGVSRYGVESEGVQFEVK